MPYEFVCENALWWGKNGKKINEQRKKLASEATLGKRTGRWTSAARFSSPVCAGLTSLANFFPLIFPSVEPIHRPKSVNGMLNVKDQCRAEN